MTGPHNNHDTSRKFLKFKPDEKEQSKERNVGKKRKLQESIRSLKSLKKHISSRRNVTLF